MSVMTLAGAINAGLRRAMEQDPRVLLMGEDIGRLGGVFRVTDGLRRDFGADRVIDTPLAESGIVGTAIGLALRGYRPVCEIQFDGFIYPAFNQIVSHLAKLRARSGGALRPSVVIRVPVGGGIGAVEHHSESNEAYFAHTAGLRVVACATPGDAYHLIQDSIRCDDPVLFYEPKRRYWDRAEVDEDGPSPGLDKGVIIREGTDCAIVTYGSTVRTALDAAEAAAEDGVSVMVADLRSVSPLDTGLLRRVAETTGRVVVVHEAPRSFGVGAEIAAYLLEHCFHVLEAPVIRVGGYDIPYPPGRAEGDFLPEIDRILDAIDRSLSY